MRYDKLIEYLPEAIGFAIGWRLRDHHRGQRVRAQQDASKVISFYAVESSRLV
jgi:hypothetical protein